MWQADGDRTAATQMARDEALWRTAQEGRPAGRVYDWDEVHVTVGRNQTFAPRQVRWTRRPTGGKAVLHGHDLTIGWAVPLAAFGLSDESRSVKAVYRAMAGPLIRALNAVGIPAELAETTRFVRNAGKVADCFAHISPNDIVNPASGQKVCGCALALGGGAALLQASVPVRRPAIDPADLGLEGSAAWTATGATVADLAEALVRTTDLGPATFIRATASDSM